MSDRKSKMDPMPSNPVPPVPTGAERPLFDQDTIVRLTQQFASVPPAARPSLLRIATSPDAIAQSHVEVPMILTSVPSAIPDPTAP